MRKGYCACSQYQWNMHWPWNKHDYWASLRREFWDCLVGFLPFGLSKMAGRRGFNWAETNYLDFLNCVNMFCHKIWENKIAKPCLFEHTAFLCCAWETKYGWTRIVNLFCEFQFDFNTASGLILSFGLCVTYVSVPFCGKKHYGVNTNMFSKS